VGVVEADPVPHGERPTVVRALPFTLDSSPLDPQLDSRPGSDGGERRAFAAFGLRFGIACHGADLLDQLALRAPPGSKPVAWTSLDREFHVSAVAIPPLPSGAGEDRAPPAETPPAETTPQHGVHWLYRLDSDGDLLVQTVDRDRVLCAFDAALDQFMALHARDRLFVHAGVVGWRGRALLLPGPSLAGKTSLVAALLRQGATYYSDECAVLDSEGLVRPYPRALGIRLPCGRRRSHSVADLGVVEGTVPLPVGLIAVTRYAEGAEWAPTTLSPGEIVLALLSNTPGARHRTRFAFEVLTRCAQSACGLESLRGEAEQAAAQLLKRLEQSAPRPRAPAVCLGPYHH